LAGVQLHASVDGQYRRPTDIFSRFALAGNARSATPHARPRDDRPALDRPVRERYAQLMAASAARAANARERAASRIARQAGNALLWETTAA
jgi:crotonobetainyl-CoA:carnitine CoA-transferase CaiB-like acyl-CoA transferase